jgi:hypothetical protein
MEWIKVLPDHLEVKVVGSPSVNVLRSEVGRKVPEIVGVGDPKQQICHQALAVRECSRPLSQGTG